MNKCSQLTPKCDQNVYKNDTFSRVTPNMKNCVLTAQAAADGGSNDPENHQKRAEKNNLRANTLHALVFVCKSYKKSANMVLKNNTFGVEKPSCLHFGPWGSEQPKRCPQSCSGTAGCLLVRTQTDLLTTQTRGALFSGASPAQPSPLRPLQCLH